MGFSLCLSVQNRNLMGFQYPTDSNLFKPNLFYCTVGRGEAKGIKLSLPPSRLFLVVVAVQIYLWLCIFSFYMKLKCGDIAAPGTAVHQPNSVDQPANQLHPNTGGYKYTNVTPGP